MSAARWQASLELLQSQGRLPSIVGGVLRGGELAWTGGAGAVPGGDLSEVQYRIGSITKTLVAVAVLRLRDEGLLSLEDPIGRFVPETGYAASTVRSLLAHTSGMQSEPAGPWWERSPGVDVATLLDVNDASGAVTVVGDYFHYSNLGFALLGEAVARIRGASWWDVVSSELLAPLGMTRTSYDAQAPSAQGFSVDHFTGTLTREPHQDTGAMAPAGQVWSTVADLARWAAFLASGHPDVLSAETLREMSEPTPPAADYGLGLQVLPLGGRTLVGHTGSMPGFVASLFVHPESGDGTVALANATTGLNQSQVPALLLADDDVAPGARWVPTTHVPESVADLTGLWFWGNSAVELRWHNETLELRSLAMRGAPEVFELRDGGIVGTSGYHRGETLHAVRRPDGTVSHLECATFVYTRTAYDPDVEIAVTTPS